MVEENAWMRKVREDPDHSRWYIDRFQSLEAEGHDLHGETRLIDAIAPRTSAILDAGCGPGRVGGRLAQLGHRVVGVDCDSTLIDQARADYAKARWIVGDLAELRLESAQIPNPPLLNSHRSEPHTPANKAEFDRAEFDIIVSCGNVMTFLAPNTRQVVLENLARHLSASGRLVVGFGAGRDYDFDEFFERAARAGLEININLSTWDLRPFESSSEFLVSVLSRQ